MAEYITELANDIAKCCPDLVENGCGNDNCVACLAFKLIGLGYEKQNDTADVVPKSEVERLETEIRLLTENSISAKYPCCVLCSKGLILTKSLEEYDELLADIASEVAREIFEDMQSCLIQRHWNGLDIVSFEFDAVKYAELKKKYTKEGEDKE